jgi:hypothetical protein
LWIEEYALVVCWGNSDKFKMRSNMTNLKAILSAAGTVALLASPALAKADHHRAAAPAEIFNAHGSAAAPRAFVTPYAPDLPQQPHEVHGATPDFQLGGNR